MTDAAPALDLTASQARVLGSLLEKELVTPDAYPTTLNALVAACNQTSNRDPVFHLDPAQVETAALTLKSKGLLRVVYPGSGERATRYRQTADEAFELDVAERAVICLLLLRGAQTAAELRSRSERLHRFADGGAVETVLDKLAGRPEPLVARVERQPGQKEPRWIQLLEMDAAARAVAGGSAAGEHHGHHVTAGALEPRISALEARLEALVDALGDLVDLPPAVAGSPVDLPAPEG
jgi:uncharacterized protein YceH (UPF0502 family)